MSGDGLYFNHGNSGHTRRSGFVPPHMRYKFSPDPAADIGLRYQPRNQRGRGRGFPDQNPIALATSRVGNLRISDPKTNEASADGSTNAIDFTAYDDIPVETSGSDVPPPASSFAEIDLGEVLNRNIQRCRYVKPTPVQRYAIPISLSGRDLMACAQTGSGKTAAFCFPIISRIVRNMSVHADNGHYRGGWVACPLALILSPTRELSCQIHEEANKFCYQTGVRVAVVYGGAPAASQLRDLGKGVDILVATPGRLIDLIERSRISLGRVKYLALDEADRMLDMGFEPQIRKIVEQMNMPPPGTRQTMLFSATFPHAIQQLASDFLSNYIFLTVGRVGSSTELIEQRVEFVSDMDKRSLLVNILRAEKPQGSNGKQPLTLVFVETKRSADSLQNWLCRNGFPATSIHGDRNQPEREQALRSFKCGATPLMVATDVAARGLDIPHVAHVINFDLPRDIDGYVHRIGRTGRAGKSGVATAFFSEANQPLAKALIELMKESCQEVPDWLSEYAKNSSNGGERGRQYGGGRFGGHDFRKDAPIQTGGRYGSYSNGGGIRSYGSYGGSGCDSSYGGAGVGDGYNSYGGAGGGGGCDSSYGGAGVGVGCDSSYGGSVVGCDSSYGGVGVGGSRDSSYGGTGVGGVHMGASNDVDGGGGDYSVGISGGNEHQWASSGEGYDQIVPTGWD